MSAKRRRFCERKRGNEKTENMIEALLFDLDGTLIRTNELHAQAFAKAFQRFGFCVPAERITIEIGKGGDQLVPALLGATAEKEHGEDIRKAWKEEFLESIGQQKVAVCPGAVELLHQCRKRGLKLALATSGEPEALEALEKSSGVEWRKQFDVVITSADAPHSKPAPHILLAALEKLGLSGAATAMIGDTPYDALASRGAGVACIGVQTGGHAPDDLREAGCRVVYADTSGILADLDNALETCSPLQIALSSDKMEELMRAALEESRAALEAGEMPLGAVVANTRGDIIARAKDARRSLNDPLARAELRALVGDGSEAKIIACSLEPSVLVAGALIDCGVDSAVFALESPLDGATHRLSSPRAPGQLFPRFLAGTLPDEARALWEKWLENHPGDEFARSIVKHAQEK
jgi:HAD superfamily hydrolase (TIGR01509 family)